MEGTKCIVKGCTNHKEQGEFVGDLCKPCHTMITTGEIGSTNSFLKTVNEQEVAKVKNELDDFYKKQCEAMKKRALNKLDARLRAVLREIEVAPDDVTTLKNWLVGIKYLADICDYDNPNRWL